MNPVQRFEATILTLHIFKKLALFSKSVFSSEGCENAPWMGLLRAALPSEIRPLTVTAGWRSRETQSHPE